MAYYCNCTIQKPVCESRERYLFSTSSMALRRISKCASCASRRGCATMWAVMVGRYGDGQALRCVRKTTSLRESIEPFDDSYTPSLVAEHTVGESEHQWNHETHQSLYPLFEIRQGTTRHLSVLRACGKRKSTRVVLFSCPRLAPCCCERCSGKVSSVLVKRTNDGFYHTTQKPRKLDGIELQPRFPSLSREAVSTHLGPHFQLRP